MKRRSSGFLGTAIASAALSALMVLVLFGAGPTNAGHSGLKKHAAIEKSVTVDGSLEKDGDAWVIKLTAVNAAIKEQECSISASLMSIEGSMMSRVGPMPREIWKTTVAVKVPASGEAKSQVAVPEEFAKRLAKKKASPKADPFESSPRFNVRFKAQCEAASGDHIS